MPRLPLNACTIKIRFEKVLRHFLPDVPPTRPPVAAAMPVEVLTSLQAAMSDEPSPSIAAMSDEPPPSISEPMSIEKSAASIESVEAPTSVPESVQPPPLLTPGFNLGPLKFRARDSGFFSNFNFLVGEMYLGRVLYPLFTLHELMRHHKTLKHFCYFDQSDENAWFKYFKPIAYYDGDTTHSNTEYLASLPDTCGEFASPEFRVPAITKALYARPDFTDWRIAVNESIQGKIQLADDLHSEIDLMLERMPSHRIGAHVRHPSHLVEQGRIFSNDYFSVIDELLKERPDAGIFLATDNDLAIAAFRSRYGDKVFYYPGFIRQTVGDVMDWAYSLATGQSDHMGFVSGVPFQTHYRLAEAGGGSEGLRAGKEAVIDGFTLAACHDFVCTASNFTLSCAFLNPRQRQHLILPTAP
jgi:hypothetical protein